MEPIQIVDQPFNEFRLGDSASFVKDVLLEEIETFAALSGDQNPLHMNEGFAASGRYKKRIAHGMLVAAPISTLAGHLIPGKQCVLLEVSSRFIHPVFPGDQLTYQATITQISQEMRVLKVKVDVRNQEGVIVLEGTYVAQINVAEKA